jgi:membrane associated rhomboid family serine protease
VIPLKDNVPTLRRPVVTIALIAINVAVYLYQAALGSDITQFIVKYGAIPYRITHISEFGAGQAVPIGLTLFTSMFLHGGWFHLGFNMLYLWVFGNNIEDKLGPVRFIVFYLLAGVIAVLTFVVTDPNAEIPLVGASGAVAGILGAYMIAFPRARVLTLIWVLFFVRLIWLPAVFFLGFWFVLQIFSGLPVLAGAGASEVAYFAHIGGFIFGLIYCRFSRIRRGGRFQ